MDLDSATESIDVGSMFLMDMSLDESDSLEQQQQQQLQQLQQRQQLTPTGGHLSFSSSNQSRQQQVNDLFYLYGERAGSLNKVAQGQQRLQASETTTSSAADPATKQTSFVPLSTGGSRVSSFYMNECQSLSSISDESFVASYGDGLSLTASSRGAELDEERASTTTREDSGVLDMKDLEVQLYASYDGDKEDAGGGARQSASRENGQRQQQIRQQNKGKPISQNLTATNLINRSSAGESTTKVEERDEAMTANQLAATERTIITTTTTTTTESNQHQRQTSSSTVSAASNARQTVSASLPIQVPVRQMKKDLNKLKLGMINKAEAELAAANGHLHHHNHHHHNHHHQQQLQQQLNLTAVDSLSGGHGEQPMSISSQRRRPARPAKQAGQARTCAATDATAATADDFDQFLEQEYNDNHHNHYPIDEFEEEHLSAEDNPMKLFERIQALARSLHEDAELFGSLPPKRMLGSPIRSLGLV